MVIVTKTSKAGIHYFPKPTTRITASVLINGAEMKNELIEGVVKRSVSKYMSEFECRIRNPEGVNTANIQLGHVVKVYADFSNGTTQIFEGTVQSIRFINIPPYIIIIANGYEADALNRTINRKYDVPTPIYQIFNDLVGFLTGHTTTNVSQANEMGNSVIVSWSGKSVWGAMQDLMMLTGNNFDFYCDFSKDWHVFRKGSIKRLTEGVIFGRTLKEITAEDNVTDASNSVTVQGAPLEGFQIMYTKPTGYGSSAGDMIIKDTNLTTYEAVKAKAEQLAIVRSTTEKKGRATAT